MKMMKKLLASSLAALTLTGSMMTVSFADTYYPKYKGSSFSIVEGLKAVGVDPSFDNRESIAKRNGIKNYEGTSQQNTQLLNKLKKGKLIKKKSPASYKISFNANGGKNKPEAITAKAEKSVKLPKSVPERTGYLFLGWSTSKTAKEAQYKAGGSIKPSKNLTLYAVWTFDPDAEIYTLRFNANGGKNAPKSVKAPEQSSVSLELTPPTREEYIFLGWSKDKNADTPRFTKTIRMTGDITLYAVWKPIIYYSLSYDANGGKNAPKTERVEEMTPWTLNSGIPVRKGWAFLGWSRDKKAKTPEYDFNASVKLGKDRTLYAVWKKNTGTKSLTTHKTYNIRVTNKAKPNRPHYTNAAGKRSTEAYNAVIDQFLVATNPRYAMGSGMTFCNIFAWDVCSAMGTTLPHWMRGSHTPASPFSYGAFEVNVNTLYNWLEKYGKQYGWTEVTAEKAQLRADKGYPAFVIWKNPTGAAGHIAIVRPQGDGRSYSEKNGCVIAQAGAVNTNRCNVVETFGEERMPELRYWTAK